jgi:Mn-dependent DtxR family transcriptional regulator
MGSSERTVESYLTELRRKGFLRKEHAQKGGREQRKAHDLKPLIERLNVLLSFELSSTIDSDSAEQTANLTMRMLGFSIVATT